MKTTKERKNKKTLIALLLLLVAFIVIISYAVAFFSDYVKGNVAATAGTLDLTGTMALSRYYTIGGIETADPSADTTGAGIVNLNPGDIIYIGGNVKNAGNKSAWLRSVISLTFTPDAKAETSAGKTADLGGFAIYSANTTNAAIRAGTATPIATLSGNTYSNTTTPVIINGTGNEAEVELGGIDTTLTGVPAGFKLYFLPADGNEYQKCSLSASITTQAVQYRNNSPSATDGATANWAQVNAMQAEFSLQP